MNLALENVELHVGPMIVTALNQFLRNLAELLKRDFVFFHQHCDCPQTNHILKRVNAAVRNVTIFVSVPRLKEARAVPRPKLAMG
jgi:hypothetical protein